MKTATIRVATLALLVGSVFTTGCGSDPKGDPRGPQTTDASDPPPPTEPSDPKDEVQDYDSRSDTDLQGRDVNGNFVRDDVEVWLEATFSGQVLERMSLHAELYQRALISPDDEDVPGFLQRIEDNGYCLWSILDTEKPRTTRELFARTMNTQLRYEHFEALERQVRGAEVARPLPSEDEFASRCEPR